MSFLDLLPYHSRSGELQGFDMFVKGEWIGSRRTISQCFEEFYRHRRRE